MQFGTPWTYLSLFLFSALEKEVRELKLDLRIEKRNVEEEKGIVVKKVNLLTYIREREQKTKVLNRTFFIFKNVDLNLLITDNLIVIVCCK